jgi:hypothetical protein
MQRDESLCVAQGRRHCLESLDLFRLGCDSLPRKVQADLAYERNLRQQTQKIGEFIAVFGHNHRVQAKSLLDMAKPLNGFQAGPVMARQVGDGDRRHSLPFAILRDSH